MMTLLTVALLLVLLAGPAWGQTFPLLPDSWMTGSATYTVPGHGGPYNPAEALRLAARYNLVETPLDAYYWNSDETYGVAGDPNGPYDVATALVLAAARGLVSSAYVVYAPYLGTATPSEPAPASPAPPAVAAPVGPLILTGMIAVMGDSITQGMPHTMETPYPKFLTIWLGIGRVLNLGQQGNTCADLITKWPLVVAAAPQAVIFACGVNDYEYSVPLATTQGNLEHLIALAKGAGIEPIVLETFPRPQYAALATMVKAVAVATGVRFVPIAARLRDPNGSGKMHPKFAPDELHTSDRGNHIIAEAIAEALGWKDGLRD